MRKITRILLWVIVVIAGIIYFWSGLRYGLTGLNLIGVSVSDAKIIIESLQAFIQSMAIIVAGVWTYERFIKDREDSRVDYPYPEIQQRIEHHVLENDLIYLTVFISVTNEGKAKLDLRDGRTYVRQITPLLHQMKQVINSTLEHSQEVDIRLGKAEGLFIDGGQRIGWLTLGGRDWINLLRKGTKILEPGQTREFQIDFLLLESDVEVIEVTSHIAGKDNGSEWQRTTLHSLESKTA